MSANYIIDEVTDMFVLLIDVGPWHQYQTITNAAEEVVDEICTDYDMTRRHLIYIDSEGEPGELLIDHSTSRRPRFAGFAPAPDRSQLESGLRAGE